MLGRRKHLGVRRSGRVAIARRLPKKAKYILVIDNFVFGPEHGRIKPCLLERGGGRLGVDPLDGG